MVREEEQGILAGNSAQANPGVLGQVRDRVMESFQGGEVLRGRGIIDAQAQEVRDHFADLQRKQKNTRTKTTNLITQTKNDLKQEESNRKSKLHETFIKSMLAAKLEAACQQKMKLDNIHIDIISTIEEIDTGPEEGPQWVAVQEYIAQIKENWEEYNAEITKFREFLAQEDEKIRGEQEEEAGEGRANSQGRQPKWRPEIGMDPGPVVEDITKGEW